MADEVKRRSFVAAAGWMAMSARQAIASRGKQTIQSAVATICCDGFGDEDFKYSLEAIPKLGVDNVELNCWYARNLTPAGIVSIQQRCKARNLRPISVQASSFGGGRSHDIAREVSRLMWLMEVCDRLGCQIIKCTGARRDTAGGLDSLVKVLNAITPEAERRRIRVVLENHHQNVLEFPEDYEHIFGHVQSSAIGMCFDMGHFARSGVPMEPIIDQWHKRIFHIDVKDADAVGGTKFVRFGTGIVDCPGLIQRCVDLGYSGYLVLELSLIDRETMLADLRKGLEITRQFESA